MTAPTAVPQTPAEFEDWLHGLDDIEKLTASLKDGSFARDVQAYAQKIHAKDGSIAQQVKEQVQVQLHAMLDDNKINVNAGPKINLNEATGRPSLDRSARSGTRHNPRAVGAGIDGVFGDFTSFAQAIWNKGRPDPETLAKLAKIQDYQEKVPSEGGFLVPEEFRTELFQLSMESAIVRPRAMVVPMASETLRFPKIDETSRVSSVFGGIVVYRTEEGADLVESQAAFGMIKLEATKQTALAHVTNELIRDWGAFDAFIRGAFPAAITFYEDLDFLSGPGAGAPIGALNVDANTAIVTVAKQTNQTAATILWENAIKMYARMLPSSLGTAVWLASPDTFSELATMALNVGTGGSAVWLVDAHGAPVLTLLGRPVIMTEKAPAVLGTQGDLSLVDFGMYLLGDRQMMTIESSEHVKFTSDKTTYRMIARNDGRPWLEQAITPHNNSAPLSPFVQLATRS
jgi:HK97 family phage major capsid protein